MRALMFDGAYEDQYGTEPLLWQIVPSDRYGRMRWYEIRTKIRGVEIWGRDFDGLGPDDPEAARAASLPLDPSDDLTGCVLTGELPVVVDVAGQHRASVVSFSLDLRPGPAHPPANPANLHLSIVVDGATYQVSDGWLEDGLLRLEAALPSDTQLVACITCLYSDYSPGGHGLMGMNCHRDAKAQYLAVRSKADYWKVPVTEEVPETYRCAQYERRVPGTGYRG